MFNEAEDTANPQVEEPALETITYQLRKKQTGQRAELLKDLPVVTAAMDNYNSIKSPWNSRFSVICLPRKSAFPIFSVSVCQYEGACAF
ncbi:MAG TPA: hypothetical protein DCZ10_19790 [Pelotomaculum sp.]|nr:hypothetical protein [Pelotomaculum sp.]